MSEKLTTEGFTPEAKTSAERNQEIGELALKSAFEVQETIGDPNLGAITAPLYMTTADFTPKAPSVKINIPYASPDHLYTESQLANNPALRYSADPNDFPLFSLQTEHTRYGGEETRVQRPLDATLSEYVTRAAGLVKTLAGDAYAMSGAEKLPAADHVIYLDKSARPVSWLVDEFWQDFASDIDKPTQSFLAIDRSPWLNHAGQKVDPDGRYIDGERAGELAHYDDFERGITAIMEAHPERVKEELAKVRALYIEGGIDSEDPDAIMNTPTVLDGKNITIVDEVQRTGTTSGIAKWLLEHAIPEARSVNFVGFWHPVALKSPDGKDTMISSVPVWYSAARISGRGVAEIRPEYYEEQFSADPTPVNRARKFSAELLGTPFNPESEQIMDARFSSPSLELRKEVSTLHDYYEKGRVFLMPTIELGMSYRDYMTREGLTPQKDERYDSYIPSTSITAVLKNLRSRPAVKF